MLNNVNNSDIIIDPASYSGIKKLENCNIFHIFNAYADNSEDDKLPKEYIEKELNINCRGENRNIYIAKYDSEGRERNTSIMATCDSKKNEYCYSVKEINVKK